MAKLGRPFVYQAAEERPVTFSLRIPADLAAQLKGYASRHRQSMTELLLDGLRWRLAQAADPREQVAQQEYYDNTVLQDLVKPAYLLDEGIPFDEDVWPVRVSPAPAAPVAAAPAARTRAAWNKLPDETLAAIADERTRCEGLSLSEFSRRLHAKGIYSRTAKDGSKVPAGTGKISEWLRRAREQGLL